MKDEIKEILDTLREQHSTDIMLGKEIANDFAEYKLNYKEMTLLLNYITNLQEELKSANESITWWQNRFNAVEEENKKLKEHK